MKATKLLGVNIDHVATVRQARGEIYPDPVHAAFLAELAGADGITVHLREDRRHIQERDVRLLKEVIKTRLNLEMAVSQEMIDFAIGIRPAYCCFVPEKREELTTEGGLDILAHPEKIKIACRELHQEGIEVSLFIDPVEAQIVAAKNAGAHIVELHTGEYAKAKTHLEIQKQLKILQGAATLAHDLGLQVNAGHGLHYHNVQAIVAIPEIIELNIGHAIVAQALMVGFPKAVKQMKKLMR
jgi:pyridoxine 5-phosphate synthase